MIKNSAKKSKHFSNYLFFFIFIIGVPLIASLYMTKPLKWGFVKRSQSKLGPAFDIIKFSKVQENRPLDWIRIKDISKKGIKAFILGVDEGFYQHPGIMINTMLEKKSIHQRIIKNIFLKNKVASYDLMLEIPFSLALDFQLTKIKTVEVYVNMLEFGPGKLKINAVAKKYFGKRIKNLSARDGAYLSYILKFPSEGKLALAKMKKSTGAKDWIMNILNRMQEGTALKPVKDKIIPQKVKKSPTKKKRPKRKKIKKPLKIKKEKIVNDKLRHIEANDDGKSFEKRFENDNDLNLGEVPEFDPDAILDDDSGQEEEFNVE